MKSELIRNPVILSLDVDTKNEVDFFVNQLGSQVGAIKLGPRLVMKYGADLINHIAHHAPVFVDNKYFDITSTMEASVRASFDAGATLVTVHALSGPESLKALSELEAKLNQIRPFKILAVTILTSWNEQSYPVSLKTMSVKDHVCELALQVLKCGLSGIVCSGHELELLKNVDLFKVTPGIRLPELELENKSHDSSTADDQKRVMTPKLALENGSSALVIGRPILKASDPKKALDLILESL